MNRKKPQPLCISMEGRNPSITEIKKGLNPSLSNPQATVKIPRPSPPPPPPAPPVVKK
jgi:hypothetical protein